MTTSSHPARKPLFIILCIASALVIVMLLGRIWLDRAPFPDIRGARDLADTRGVTFLFLAWNLFLAWIPYLISLWLSQKEWKGWWLVAGLALWLLFFPNAPYLVTDLLHLNYRPPVPFWYDLMLLFSAALTGLTLGLVSLAEVHVALARHTTRKAGWCLMVYMLALGSFGVWMGRYLRHNSWDIITNPDGILISTFQTLTTKHGLLQASGVSLLFFVLMALGYALLYSLMRVAHIVHLENEHRRSSQKLQP